MRSKRHEFSLPSDQHYLNCAYMSPLSRRVQAAGEVGIRRKAAPWEIRSADFFTGCQRVRELFARLIGAPDPSRIAIIPAASYGLAIAARNTPVAAGQNVVTLHHQFPSNVHVWRRLCDSANAQFRVVRPAGDGSNAADRWNEAILEAIDADTAAVALDTVHWTCGTRFDLERIAERAREVGAALILDGTQSVGVLPFNLQRIRPDALICPAYKWLMGPYSIGAAYFGPRYDDGTPLEETWMGREGSRDFAGLVEQSDRYRSGAARFDVGEVANFVLIPMFVTALEQLLEWGVEEIRDHCGDLTDRLIRDTGGGETGLDRRQQVGHLIGLHAPDGVDPEALKMRLREAKVFVSVRGRAIRVSPHIYNDVDDIEALRRVLSESGMPIAVG